jgi:maleamate amidohydrolase
MAVRRGPLYDARKGTEAVAKGRTSAVKERIWDKFLTERDKQVIAASGFGARSQGFGKRPALLIIDVNYAFVGDRPEPILESIKRWRNSCGEEGWRAIKVIEPMLHACRAKGIPVIYTTGTDRRADLWDRGAANWKNGRGGENPKAMGLTNRNGRAQAEAERIFRIAAAELS